MDEARSEKKKMLLWTLGIATAIVGVLALITAITANSYLNQIGRVEESTPTLSAAEIEQVLQQTDPTAAEEVLEVIDPADVTVPSVPPIEIEHKDEVINVLLIGQDRRGNTGRQRSDAMILCTLNTQKKTIVMTSFLRDLYVKLPDYNGWSYGSNRINATYVIGGMEMLDECLKQNFGVEVDYNIEVDFTGFEQIIDLVGGVEVELTAAEVKWMDNGLKKGVNLLDGANALEYARIRKLDSDFGRSNRQRNVLMALFKKVKTLSLTEITELANSVFPMLTTDMTNEEIIDCLLRVFPMLSDLKFVMQCVPAEGTYRYANISGMEVILPDYEANAKLLREWLTIE